MTLEMTLGGEVGAERSISRRESLLMGVIPSYSQRARRTRRADQD